jgi:hypothetical protein
MGGNMITAWQIYLITRLDALIGVSVGILIFTGLVIIVTLVKWQTDSDNYDWEDNKENLVPIFKKWLKIEFALLIMSLFVIVTIPSSKEAAAILIIPKIANNEHVQNIPNKTLELVEKQLDQWIQNIEKKK